jgi:hypothetical protein
MEEDRCFKYHYPTHRVYAIRWIGEPDINHLRHHLLVRGRGTYLQKREIVVLFVSQFRQNTKEIDMKMPMYAKKPNNDGVYDVRPFGEDDYD